MRVWGRVLNKWVEVSTDANGNSDYVYVTALIQALKLSLNESPVYANYGLPAQQSIVTQVWPAYYVSLMQSLYSQYFASLVISQVAPQPNANPSNPTYNVAIMLNNGTLVNQTVPT